MTEHTEETDSTDNRSLHWGHPLRIGFYLACVLLAFLLLLTLVVEPYVRHRIQESVHESSHYLLKMDDLNINLFGGGISLEKVVLQPDSGQIHRNRIRRQPPGMGTLKSDRISVGGFSFPGWILRDELDIGSIVIDTPTLAFTPSPQLEDTAAGPGQTPAAFLYEWIRSFSDSARVGRFEIRNGDIALRDTGGSFTVFSLKGANLALRDIVLDSSVVADSNLFITDRIEWSSRSFAWNMDNGRYRITADSVSVSSSDSSFAASALRLVPLYPRYEFALQAGEQTDRIELEIPELRGSGIDFTELVGRHRFRAGLISISGAAAEVYHDMRIHFGPKVEKKLPHRTMNDLPVELDIDSLRITSSSIHYIERQENTPAPGRVRFESLNATLSSIRRSDTLRLQAESMVMGEGRLQARMRFPPGEDWHEVEGTLGPMPIPAFNPILERVAFVGAGSGQLHGMRFSMRLGETESRGRLTMDYEDFAIEVLNRESLEQSALEDIKTFLANTFVVQRHNHDPAEEAEINFERIQHKSIFNYWWKSLLSGIKQTIGL